MIPNERMRRELEAFFGGRLVLGYTPDPKLFDHECHECAYYEKAGVCDPNAHRCSKFKFAHRKEQNNG